MDGFLNQEPLVYGINTTKEIKSMEIKTVMSNSIPDKYEKLQNGTLINVLPTEEVTADGTMYKYSQVYTTEVSEARLDKIYIRVCIEIYNQYLNSTGWYVERLNDPSSGKEIPEDVLAKRAEARVLVNELEGQLEVING